MSVLESAIDLINPFSKAHGSPDERVGPQARTGLVGTIEGAIEDHPAVAGTLVGVGELTAGVNPIAAGLDGWVADRTAKGETGIETGGLAALSGFLKGGFKGALTEVIAAEVGSYVIEKDIAKHPKPTNG